MKQQLSDIVRDLRHSPLSELGPVSWIAAAKLEHLAIIIAEFVAAQEQYDREGASDDSIQRLRAAKRVLWAEVRS